MSPADHADGAHASPPETWRLFFAVDPSPALRRSIVAHAATWRWDARARPVAPHKLHLTLLFLPQVNPERIAALLRLGAAAASANSGCLLRLDRAEVWPGGLAHLAPSQVPTPLQALHDSLLQGARDAGVACDTRQWHPHLTLARRAEPGQVPMQFEVLRWPVRGLSLQRSLLGSGRYESLGRWSLRGPGTRV